MKSGELAYVLTKPYNYVVYHLAGYLGEASLRLPVSLLVGSAVALMAVGLPHPSLAGILAAPLALALGLVLNFVAEAAIGLTAFWFEDSQPFFWIYQKLVMTIGGLFIPLELFPEALQSVARWLPFASVAYAPARLFVSFSAETFVFLLALQAIWLAALTLILPLSTAGQSGR